MTETKGKIVQQAYRCTESRARELKHLATDRGTSVQGLIEEGLNLLLHRLGKAKSGVPLMDSCDRPSDDRYIVVTGQKEKELATRLLDILRKYGQPALNVAAIS